MSIVDKEWMRTYQREWIAKRRAKFISEKGPCLRCGSKEDLQIDHRDPATKVSHRIWSWAEARLRAELAKCDVLCGECHRKKSFEKSEAQFAVPPETVKQALLLREQGLSTRKIAKALSIPRSTAWRVVAQKSRHHQILSTEERKEDGGTHGELSR